MTLTDLDLVAVRDAFDRAAPGYDGHAVLQQEIERRLLERVDYFELQPARVLDLGCGTGNGSRALTDRFPGADVLSLDWSLGMLAMARHRCGDEAGSRSLCADMHRLPLASRSTDLVFSNLAVQWSPRPLDLFKELRRVLKPGGLLLFTSFGPETLFELRSAWSAVDTMPHVNEFQDIMEVGDELVAAGFQDPVLDVERLTLQYRDVLTLMRELKAIGAHNAARGRAPGLTGKQKLRRVLRAYEAFGADGAFPASYEVLFAATFAPAEGQPVRSDGGEVAEFSVESLLRSRDLS